MTNPKSWTLILIVSVLCLLVALVVLPARAEEPAPADQQTQPAAEPAKEAPTTAEPAKQDTPAPEQKEAKKESAAMAALLKVWKSISFNTLWYLDYEFGQAGGKPFNRENIGRGYWTLKVRPADWFESRLTLDTSQNDAGDWALRLKYLYGRFILPIETVVVTEPDIEFGLVHNPWFDFEEFVNGYRMQGTMFMERNQLLNSGDMGFTVGVLLGEKLPEEYRNTVSKKYPGKWGSIALGLYNGGGYHAKEANQDKVFMGRFTVRPLGFILPNLQLSYFLVYGKGNTTAAPDWRVHDFMASFEHPYFVLTGQFTFGTGIQKGDMVDANGSAVDFQGYSVFGEIKLPWIFSSLIGRWDSFTWKQTAGDSTTNRFIVGYAFHFLGNCALLLDYDRAMYSAAGKKDDDTTKLTLQVDLP